MFGTSRRQVAPRPGPIKVVIDKPQPLIDGPCISGKKIDASTQFAAEAIEFIGYSAESQDSGRLIAVDAADDYQRRPGRVAIERSQEMLAFVDLEGRVYF